MAFPVTDTQKAAFLGSHEMTSRAVLLRAGVSLGEVPLIDADVYATYGTQGGRDARITVDRNLTDLGLFDPRSDEVMLYTGIPNVVDVPIFTGRVDRRVVNSDGSVQITLESRGEEAVRAEFEVPWAAGPAGTFARGEMTRILQDVNPAWGVDTTAANADQIPGNLVWEQDRGQALDQLAKGASLIWQPDRVGSFVIYTNPYSVGTILALNPVVTLTDGVGGTTVKVSNTESREGVFNSVTVVTERVNNTEPLRVTMRDTGPSSPTMWGGPFGKQNLVVKSQTPLDLPASQQLALRILRQSLALQRSFTISTPDMPLLDPGDVFALWFRNVVYSLVVEAVSYSWSAQQDTVISARELMLIEVTDIT